MGDKQPLKETKCGKCHRPLQQDRSWCLYCGWTPSASEVSHAPKIEEEIFRSGASLATCVVATVLFGPVAVVAGGHAILYSPDPTERASSAGIALLALLLGPVPCFVQFLRRSRRWIR